MKINSMAGFAAGIFLATVICSAAYFTVGTEASKSPVQTTEKKKEESKIIKPSNEEMKAELESSGFIVQTTEEYDKSMEEAKKAAQQEEKADKDKDKEVVNTVIINVTKGMTSIDVGKMLEKAKLVDDGFKFSKDVEKKGVENRLRPGLYKVDSEMTHDEMIAAIFS